MTATTLEREPQQIERQTYQEAVKAYFAVLSSWISISDLEIVGATAAPELDFIVRANPDQLVELTDRLANLSFDIGSRYGVLFSAVVLPRV
jgi:hypothetical protein